MNLGGWYRQVLLQRALAECRARRVLLWRVSGMTRVMLREMIDLADSAMILTASDRQ